MKIEIVEYNPAWVKAFEEEKRIYFILLVLTPQPLNISEALLYQSTGKTGYRYIYRRFAF